MTQDVDHQNGATERPVPTFTPDPELIGNVEGNESVRKGDQDAAREFLVHGGTR